VRRRGPAVLLTAAVLGAAAPPPALGPRLSAAEGREPRAESGAGARARAERRWADSVLATRSLRAKVAQMFMR